MNEIARGNYRYWRDGEPQPIDEPWSLHQRGETRRLVGERRRSGQPLMRVEAERRDGDWLSLAVDWAAEPALGVAWSVQGDALCWRRRNGEAGERSLPPGTQLFPLLRAAAGPLLRALLARPATVAVPALHDPGDRQAFLLPILSRRSAEQLGDDDALGAHLRYRGGEYGEDGSDYWLRHGDLVQRYRWQASDGCWEVALTDAAFSDDFSGIAA